MAILRIKKTNNYTVMSNYHFKEKDMSLKAKGLLSLMLSLPEDWDYSIDGLAKLSKDGKDSVMSALAELEKFNYLIRTQTKDEDGKFAGYDYDVYEEPYTEKPFTENPNTEKPNTENPQQLNTNPLSTYVDKNTNNKKEEESHAKDRSIDDVINEQDEKLRLPLKEYIKMRKAIKKPITTHGLELAIAKLKGLSKNINEQIEIVNQSVMNSWQGLFPLKNNEPVVAREEETEEQKTQRELLELRKARPDLSNYSDKDLLRYF